MGNRPRINHAVKMDGAGKVEDALEYKANKGSPNARNIEDISRNITMSLWYDKHYIYRELHGDENGPREGIDSDLIKNLVSRGFRHLLFYSARLENFKFLNHENNSDRAIRVVIQDSNLNGAPLNVAIEAHFIDFSKYEITVKTAMCTNTFRYFDGQYILEILELNSSILKRFSRGAVNEIFSCEI